MLYRLQGEGLPKHTSSPYLFFQHSNIDAWIYSSYPHKYMS